MKVRQALIDELDRKHLRDPDAPADQLYGRWLRFQIAGRSVRVFPIGLHADVLALHDAHHLLTGYGTDLRGEVEIAAWELASGGCGSHWLMWMDRLGVIFGALLVPRAALAAFRRGRRMRNLYRLEPSAALDLELDEAARFVRADEA